MATRRFRTRPVEIEAVRFSASVESYMEVLDFVGGGYIDQMFQQAFFRPTAYAHNAIGKYPDHAVSDFGIFVKGDAAMVGFEVYDRLHNTWVKVAPGDWIIRGLEGEYYPCVDSTFQAKYEELGEKIHKVKVEANRPGPVDNTAFYDSYYEEGHQ